MFILCTCCGYLRSGSLILSTPLTPEGNDLLLILVILVQSSTLAECPSDPDKAANKQINALTNLKYFNMFVSVWKLISAVSEQF